jgi:hypothetical protein
MKTPSDFLWRLIKSLSRTEKLFLPEISILQAFNNKDFILNYLMP